MRPERVPPDWRAMSAALRLSLFYAAFFFATGIQIPFWPVWLASRGLGPAEIGALLAISQWVKVAANPLVGAAADRTSDRRRVMLLLGAVAVAGYGLCLPGHSFVALLLPSALVAATLAALVPLADSLALAAPEMRLGYGRVRLWGTIAFIAATLLGGRILQGRGPDVILYLLLATGIGTAASCAVLPHVALRARTAGPPPWRLFLERRHILFLGATLLIQSSHAVYYGFGTLYWRDLGFADITIAWLWAEGAIAEVVLFYFGANLVRRLHPHGLMMLGGVGALVRWGATAAATSLPALLALQPLHALSFAAAHLGAMQYLASNVPADRANTAQSVYTAIVGGVGLGIAAIAAGALYAATGGGAYYAMAAMGGAGALLAARLPRHERYLASTISE